MLRKKNSQAEEVGDCGGDKSTQNLKNHKVAGLFNKWLSEQDKTLFSNRRYYVVRVPLLFLRFIGVHCWQFGFLTAFLNFLLVLGSLIWNYLLKSRWNAKHLLYGQGACFDWSALKEFSELVLPKKRRRMKKVKVPELVLLYSRTSSNTLFFLVKIYWGLTLRTFWEEQLTDQFRYFNFSSYLVIFRAAQSKKASCTYI